MQGGFRLEVLDPQERPIRDLTPKTGDEPFLRGDPTALNYAAQLPADFECVNCTIRYAQSSILSLYFQAVRYISNFSYLEPLCIVFMDFFNSA